MYFCHGGYVLSAVSEHQGLYPEITHKSIEGFRRIGLAYFEGLLWIYIPIVLIPLPFP